MTDRAVSVTINYVLGLAIASIILTGMTITAGGIVDDQHQAAIRGELKVIGERMAANMMTADRLVQAGGTVVNVTVEAPNDVAGVQYSVTVTAGPNEALLTLETDTPPVDVEVPFANNTPVSNGTVSGGSLKITLDGGQLEVFAT